MAKVWQHCDKMNVENATMKLNSTNDEDGDKSANKLRVQDVDSERIT